MTLRDGGRGPAGRQRGLPTGRDDRRGGAAFAPGGVEIEELPAQPVLGRAGSRPGIGVALTAIAVALILAAGFGVLGGRPAPAPTATNGGLAVATETPATEPSAEVVVPLVTPGTPCLPTNQKLPEAVLDIEGNTFKARVYSWTGPGAEPSLAIIPRDPATAARIDVRSDIPAQIRTGSDVCAVSWSIDLDDQRQRIGLESVANAARDPGYAVQNRFALVLAPYRGGDFDLAARLDFVDVSVLATWPIRILPFDAPKPRLTLGKRDIDLAPGCDVQLTLGSGWSERVNDCLAEISRLPRTGAIPPTSGPLTFRFEDGWQMEGASLSCGSLPEQHYVADPDCPFGWSVNTGALSIQPPGRFHAWTLAINACATQSQADAANQICGTWYATLEVSR